MAYAGARHHHGLGDNSYHVVVAKSVDVHTFLDGFDVQGGDATRDPDSMHRSGGGVLLWSGAAVIQNCTIQNNRAAVAAVETPRIPEIVSTGGAAGAASLDAGELADEGPGYAVSLAMLLTSLMFERLALVTGSRAGGGMAPVPPPG